MLETRKRSVDRQLSSTGIIKYLTFMGLYDGVSRIFDRKLYRLTRQLTVYQPLERQIVFRSLMLSSSLLRWIRHDIVVRPF